MGKSKSTEDQGNRRAARNSNPDASREAILGAAGLLFYEWGFAAVSVDEIARLASTHKMTVYRLFGCKDALVASYVRSTAGQAVSRRKTLLDPDTPAPLESLRALFQLLAEDVAADGYLGDPLLKIAGEFPIHHPLRVLINEELRAFREALRELATRCTTERTEALADCWYLLWSGAASPGKTREAFHYCGMRLATLAMELTDEYLRPHPISGNLGLADSEVANSPQSSIIGAEAIQATA